MDKTEASDVVLFCLSLIYLAFPEERSIGCKLIFTQIKNLILISLEGFQFLHIQHP